ncbi:MAG: hypothetical protein AAGF95_29540 [Chloroflexota bacterium]
MLRQVVTCSFAAVFGLTTIVSAYAQTPEPPLLVPQGLHSDFRIDGDLVVWYDIQQGPLFPRDGDVYAARLTDRTTFPVATGTGDQTAPAVTEEGNEIVVWAESSTGEEGTPYDIRGKNLITDEVFDIATTSADERTPYIDGNLVVWIEATDSEGSRLMSRDLSSMANSVEVVDLTNYQLFNSYNPIVLNDGRVYINDNGTLRSIELSNTQTGPTVEAEGVIDYDVDGDTLVYTTSQEEQRRLIVLNRSTGETVYEATVDASLPRVQGPYVIWQEVLSDSSRVRGIDTDTLATFDLETATPGVNNLDLSIGDDSVWVVWQAFVESEETAIYAAPLAEIQSYDTNPSEEQRTFPETGRTLRGPFLNFWEQNGGLAVFGFPLTEAQTEVNVDDGQAYLTQYLERQRFEYHPENAGTPYEVLLGRLGVVDAEQRGLLDNEAFQPTTIVDEGNCRYFAETGHNLCGAFWGYWQAQGLEFGDTGVSFRESLALFGYPISETFTDPETGLTTQYTERARFEYHPDNPTEFQVLLGRLGAELVEE